MAATFVFMVWIVRQLTSRNYDANKTSKSRVHQAFAFLALMKSWTNASIPIKNFSTFEFMKN